MMRSKIASLTSTIWSWIRPWAKRESRMRKKWGMLWLVFLIVFRFVRLCLIAFLVQYLDLKFTLPKGGKKTRNREKNKSEVSVLRASFLSLRWLRPISILLWLGFDRNTQRRFLFDLAIWFYRWFTCFRLICDPLRRGGWSEWSRWIWKIVNLANEYCLAPDVSLFPQPFKQDAMDLVKNFKVHFLICLLFFFSLSASRLWIWVILHHASYHTGSLCFFFPIHSGCFWEIYNMDCSLAADVLGKHADGFRITG